MKAMETIKNSETLQRLNSETSDYFKPIKAAGGVIAIVGLGLKIVAVCFPATLPIGLVSLLPEMIAIGGAIWGVSVQTRQPDSKPTKKITVLGTLKNLFLK